MPFDLSTAEPVKEKPKFDLSTAKPVKATGSDFPRTSKDDEFDKTGLPESMRAGFIKPTALESLGRGLKDIGKGAAQLIGNDVSAISSVPFDEKHRSIIPGLSDAVDSMRSSNLADVKDYEARRGLDPKTDWYRIAGQAIGTAPLMAVPAIGEGYLGSIGTGALIGGAAGAITAEGEGKDPATGAALGATSGGILGGAGKLAKTGISALWSHVTGKFPGSIEDAATQKILERMAQDQKAGGPSAQDAMDLVNAARAAGKPLMLQDVVGPNTQGLGGFVARRPGESKAIATNALESRDSAAPLRISADIDNAFPSGASYDALQSLQAARLAQSEPLYAKAFKPGSAKPVQDQIAHALDETSDARDAAAVAVQQAQKKAEDAAAMVRDRSQLMGPGPGSAAKESENAENELKQAQDAYKQADAAHQKMLAHMQDIADAVKNGMQGTVWTPRIQEFLDDPIIKQGINQGLEIQRLDSLAQRKPFNPKDYAITGYQDDQPVVSKVPNMQLLDAAKHGLDQMLEEYREKTTGRLVLDRRGRSIDAVRKSFLDELDDVNPSYKAARQAWAGPSQTMDAIKFGEDALLPTSKPRDIEERVKQMSDSDKEFAKLGIANKIRETMQKTSRTGDETRRIIGDDYKRAQIRPFFDNDEDYGKFINALEYEQKMFDTKGRTLGNSATASRLSEDQSGDMEQAGRAVRAGAHAMTGNVLGVMREGLAIAKHNGLRENPELNAAIARNLYNQSGPAPSLTQPNPVPPSLMQGLSALALGKSAPAAGALTSDVVQSPGTQSGIQPAQQ